MKACRHLDTNTSQVHEIGPNFGSKVSVPVANKVFWMATELNVCKNASAVSTAVSVPVDGIKWTRLDNLSTQVAIVSNPFRFFGRLTMKSVKREPHRRNGA